MENESDTPESQAEAAAPENAEAEVPLNRAQKRAEKFHKAAEGKKSGFGGAGGRQAAGSAGAPPPKATTRMKKG